MPEPAAHPAAGGGAAAGVPQDLRLPALEVSQGSGRLLYAFAVDGKLLPSFTDVSRIRREDGRPVEGYQRTEVMAHVASIRRYLESEAPMMPTALLVAFDERVRFYPAEGMPAISYARPGTLVIPVGGDRKAGLAVDGQQRRAAIRDARIGRFPVCVTAFITDSAEEQREQFILVNSAKPLPKGLVYELLPVTAGPLPGSLQALRFPAALLRRLNEDRQSPLQGMIRTPTTPEGVIKDNSVLKMLDRSLSDGALYAFRDPRTGKPDEEQMMTLLTSFWAAVREVFGDAWDLPPRRSRLMHGAGIAGLGFLMDAIFDRHAPAGVPGKDDFAAGLAAVRDVCRWTSGTWDFGPGCQRKWNELQNTTRDIHLLTSYLLSAYKARAGRGPAGLLEGRPPAGDSPGPAAFPQGPPGPGGRLQAAYVIACSAGKAAGPAPARDLYTGQGFRSALKAAQAQAAWCSSRRMSAAVLVLSALHGLVTLDAVIAPYDRRMGEPGSVTPAAVAAQAAALGIGRGCDVYGLLPRAYLAVLDEALRPYGVWVQDVYEGCRGIGDQRSVNRVLGIP